MPGRRLAETGFKRMAPSNTMPAGGKEHMVTIRPDDRRRINRGVHDMSKTVAEACAARLPGIDG